MRKIMALILLCSWTVFTLVSCDTQKPANDVQDAKDRVKKNIESERQKQQSENPDPQEKE